MIPASGFIIATTILGTLTLRAVTSKQRQVIVESIENILEKCQNIDACNSAMMASVNNLSECVSNVRCCEEMERVSIIIFSHLWLKIQRQILLLLYFFL